MSHLNNSFNYTVTQCINNPLGGFGLSFVDYNRETVRDLYDTYASKAGKPDFDTVTKGKELNELVARGLIIKFVWEYLDNRKVYSYNRIRSELKNWLQGLPTAYPFTYHDIAKAATYEWRVINESSFTAWEKGTSAIMNNFQNNYWFWLADKLLQVHRLYVILRDDVAGQGQQVFYINEVIHKINNMENEGDICNIMLGND